MLPNRCRTRFRPGNQTGGGDSPRRPERPKSMVFSGALAIAVAVTCDPPLPIYVAEDVLEDATGDV